MSKYFLVLVLFFQVILVSAAPRSSINSAWSKLQVGVNFGTSSYSTEYNMYKSARWNSVSQHYSDPLFASGLFVRYAFVSALSAEFQYGYNQISGYGDKKLSNAEGYAFKTVVNEFVLSALIALDDCFLEPEEDRNWHMYLRGGVGTGFITKKEGEENCEIDPTNAVIIFTAGGGLSLRLSPKLHAVLDYNYRLIDTDELNGRFEELTKGENNTSLVWGAYQNIKIGVAYQFGQKSKRRKRTIQWYER